MCPLRRLSCFKSFYFKEIELSFSGHCVKSVRVRSHSGSGLYLPALGLNTEKYPISLRIPHISPYPVQMRENTDQNNSEYRHLLRSGNVSSKWSIWVLFVSVEPFWKMTLVNLKDSFLKTYSKLFSTSYHRAPSTIRQITCLLQFRKPPPTLYYNIRYVVYETTNIVVFPVNEIVDSFSQPIRLLIAFQVSSYNKQDCLSEDMQHIKHMKHMQQMKRWQNQFIACFNFFYFCRSRALL